MHARAGALATAGLAVAILSLAASSPRPVRADAVVGTGAASSCTKAALNAALTAGGNVTFNCGPDPVTITVTSRKTIGANTSIDGGNLITISGGGTTQVFAVDSGVTLSVANLTIANGGSTSANGGSGHGGAIVNRGTLNVNNTTFSGNSANASGYLSSATGGAVYNGFSSTLTVTSSTFSGNSAVNSSVDSSSAYGGAIDCSNGSTLTVSNSTFSGNSAYAPGDASDGYGGAIFNNGGTLTVTNSTFSGNRSGGGPGGHAAGGAISNNGEGTVTVTNSIIVPNSFYGGTNCSGTITNGGHNLDSDGTCGVGPVTPDPLLDPAGLANNGGPTQTIALQGDSPAINAGDETVCDAPPVSNLDQRGYVRPGLGATNCSIGAYEYNSLPPCCQCPTSCAAPAYGSCGDCVMVFGATCESGDLCVSYTPTPTPTVTPTPTNTPAANDCCQCADFCAVPNVGTCGGCAVVFGASCTGGSLCIPRTVTPTATPTSTPTATPTATHTATPTPTASPISCVGDCNRAGSVTVDEILTMVNIALGNSPISDCLPGDANNDGQITVDEILTAVNNALNGCPPNV
ncbi:MAG: choice-of-anchor Q domain-containing protein [Candidatus Binatia bacterium]